MPREEVIAKGARSDDADSGRRALRKLIQTTLNLEKLKSVRDLRPLLQANLIYFSLMRKSSVVRLAAAVFACGALFTAYTQFGNQPSKLNTIKLKDDLYVIHNDFVPGNTTALVTNDGVLLVDDKFDIDHAGIMAELKKITDKPVKYVINTHHHGDHSGGNAKFQAMDAKIVASQEAREQMVIANQPGLPDIVIEHHAHIYLGGQERGALSFRPLAH